MYYVEASNGYGDDRQSHLEPFPFTQPTPKQGDDDAELRRQLNHMGGGKSSVTLTCTCINDGFNKNLVCDEYEWIMILWILNH